MFAALGSDSDDEDQKVQPPSFSFSSGSLASAVGAVSLAPTPLEPVSTMSDLSEMCKELGSIGQTVSDPSVDRKTWDFGGFRDNITSACTDKKKGPNLLLESIAEGGAGGGGAAGAGAAAGGKKKKKEPRPNLNIPRAKIKDPSTRANQRKKKLLARGGGYADRMADRVVRKERKGKSRRKARTVY